MKIGKTLALTAASGMLLALTYCGGEQASGGGANAPDPNAAAAGDGGKSSCSSKGSCSASAGGDGGKMSCSASGGGGAH
jgi:NaMN:DMB phosphoribosyltransferase